jgi:anti-sigma regulatory factor (Ser/Thr protein kinase)
MAADESVRSLAPSRFAPEVSSVTLARHRLIDFLYDMPEVTRDTAALLVSELTTNVIDHAGTSFCLCAEVTTFALRVEVADSSSDAPAVKQPMPREIGGRGLMLVSQLADSWGTEPIPEGKRVWFELSLLPGRSRLAGDLGGPAER